jgi:hypothetical protein
LRRPFDRAFREGGEQGLMLSTRHTFNWLIAMDAGVVQRPLLLAH